MRNILLNRRFTLAFIVVFRSRYGTLLFIWAMLLRFYKPRTGTETFKFSYSYDSIVSFKKADSFRIKEMESYWHDILDTLHFWTVGRLYMLKVCNVSKLFLKVYKPVWKHTYLLLTCRYVAPSYSCQGNCHHVLLSHVPEVICYQRAWYVVQSGR